MTATLAVDGALVDHDADIGAVRLHLGRDAIIGARCGMSRRRDGSQARTVRTIR
ncbi:MAG: hypothetical protein R3D03_14315 [Geminicoccaceae bacterium]